jgi:hypothetical protein
MKQTFSILIFLFISLASFATDLLLVNNDTFYLKTFPLEELNLQQRPFGLDKLSVQVANQYPGYQAIWRVVDEKLYLERIISFTGDNSKEENIAELFEKNAIIFKTTEQRIFAGWLSMTYYSLKPYPTADKFVFLVGTYNASDAKTGLIAFEKGRVTINKLHKDHR